MMKIASHFFKIVLSEIFVLCKKLNGWDYIG